MDGEAVPHFTPEIVAEQVGERLAAVDVEVVHHEVNGFGFRVLQGQIEEYLRKLDPGSVRRGVCEVAACLGLYRTEHRTHWPCRAVRIHYRVSPHGPVRLARKVALRYAA
jgi:hypothetical protein